MARVLALVPDLLFGSKVQAALTAAGHEVTLTGNPAAVVDAGNAVDVVAVDLDAEGADPAALVAGLGAGDPPAPRTLGFYSHVDVETRERALAAGFDLVVPRSRMNREGAALVERLAGSGPSAGG
jgi:DNA-binding NarL/FixJ family response regulator